MGNVIDDALALAVIHALESRGVQLLDPARRTRVDAAKVRLLSWPTPIVASGFEMGRALQYPALSIERDFRYVIDSCA